jgi:hypothetical protein
MRALGPGGGRDRGRTERPWRSDPKQVAAVLVGLRSKVPARCARSIPSRLGRCRRHRHQAASSGCYALCFHSHTFTKSGTRPCP